jgi:hypothetical protein
LPVFVITTASFCKNMIIILAFEKTAIFCIKWAKIAEICDHNIDPWSPCLSHFFLFLIKGLAQSQGSNCLLLLCMYVCTLMQWMITQIDGYSLSLTCPWLRSIRKKLRLFCITVPLVYCAVISYCRWRKRFDPTFPYQRHFQVNRCTGIVMVQNLQIESFGEIEWCSGAYHFLFF